MLERLLTGEAVRLSAVRGPAAQQALDSVRGAPGEEGGRAEMGAQC